MKMKRSHDDTSSSCSPTRSKQSKVYHSGEDVNTKLLAQQVAEHYSKRTNQTLEEREASPIIHLKKLNNWIKSVMIQLYTRRGDAVLDLACGKIEDCRTRYNCEIDPLHRRKKFSIPARLICADAYKVHLDEALEDDAPFDICSCQFALHYSWSTEERARRALLNVSTLLCPGGTFFGLMPDANVTVRKLCKGATFFLDKFASAVSKWIE